jgi:DNA-binding LacI/PurR family transcriptional regulator
MAEPVYEQMYRFLLAEIDGGRLRPGDRVPSEKELAAQFHASRITSKKALEKLAHEGVIERARGRGSFVTSHIGAIHESGARIQQSDGGRAGQRLVAFLLPDFSETFGAQLLRAIEVALRNHNLRLVVCRTEGKRELEEAAIDDCIRLGVAGLIIYPVNGEYYNERLLRLVLNRFPITLVDRYLRGIPVASVRTDNRKAAEEIINHLLALGHRHIAFVTPPPAGTSSIEDRVQGVAAAMAEHGVPFVLEESIVQVYCTLPGAFTPSTRNVEQDEATIRHYVQSHPEVTAFVACEYPLAQLVERVLTSLGGRVPAEYSIASFDAPNTILDLTHITHIRQHEEHIAHEAVRLLMEQLDGRDTPLNVVTGHTFVMGDSTAHVRRRRSALAVEDAGRLDEMA